MRAASLTYLLLVAGCSMSGPSGAIGLKWGENVIQAAPRAGLVCQDWDPWPGLEGFEVCYERDHPVSVLGEKANVDLIRQGPALEGVQLIFKDCAERWGKVHDAVIREFGLGSDASETPYQVFRDGSLVRVERDLPQNLCRVMAAGPSLGKVYKGYLLKQGIQGLSGAMRPH